MNITIIQADLDAAIAIAKDMGLETIPDALVRGVAGVRIAAAQPAWQPIETAPKDGTWILGWAECDSSPCRISWGANHDGRRAWCTIFGSFHGGYITHWMPLPATPAEPPAHD